METVPTECLYGVSDDDDVELKVDDEAASDPGEYMRSESVGHQRPSPAGNLDSSSSIDCQAETSTTRSEAPSLFDICVEIPTGTVTTENSQPDEHSSETRLETAKTECADGNPTTGKD